LDWVLNLSGYLYLELDFNLSGLLYLGLDFKLERLTISRVGFLT